MEEENGSDGLLILADVLRYCSYLIALLTDLSLGGDVRYKYL